MNMRIPGICFTLLTSSVCGVAQLPAAAPVSVPVHHSLSLDVRPVGSGGAGHAVDNTHGDVGKYRGVDGRPLATSTQERRLTQNHQTVLSIAVRNFSTQPDEAQLEWYFFAEPVGGTKTFILNNEVSKVSLKGSETQTVTATSLEVGTTTIQKTTGADGYSSISSTEQTGTKPKGWMVRLVSDGKVIDVKGSDLTTEGYGKDDAKLEALKKSAPVKKQH